MSSPPPPRRRPGEGPACRRRRRSRRSRPTGRGTRSGGARRRSSRRHPPGIPSTGNPVEPGAVLQQGAWMTAFVSHTTIDCRNAYELSEWWKQLLGYVDVEGDPNLPGHEECMILDPETHHRLLFIEVPEDKQVKNRIHLDLSSRT